MADYMLFRAVVPPGFDLEEYGKRSGEPIRFDAVTVVEADTPQDAVNTLIQATGIISTGFAACECTLVGFGAKSQISRGGKLVSSNRPLSIEAPEDTTDGD